MTRVRRGRPLRFVGAVAFGWIALRVAMLWSAQPHVLPAVLPATIRPSLPPLPLLARSAETIGHASALEPGAAGSRPRSARRARVPAAAGRTPPHLLALVAPLPDAVALPQASASPSTTSAEQGRAEKGVSAIAPPLPGRDHWQASSWLVLRPGRGLGAAPAASQLGGSQYGVRLAYGLGPARRLAAYARLAGPLHGAGAEAAIGVEWQPARAPVRLSIEHRFGLDGIRGGPGAGVVAGLDRGIAPGLRLEAYGQAGMILRAERAPYADGAVRFAGEVAHGRRSTLALGVGAWGAAQREGQRLDIGPSLVAAVPIGAVRARLALDWRQRVAGDARPGSGLAFTLGSDF